MVALLLLATLVSCSMDEAIQAWKDFADRLGDRKMDVKFIAEGQGAEISQGIVDMLLGKTEFAGGALNDVLKRIINSAQVVNTAGAQSALTGDAYYQVAFPMGIDVTINVPAAQKGIIITGFAMDAPPALVMETVGNLFDEMSGKGRKQLDTVTATRPTITLTGSAEKCEFVILQNVHVQAETGFREIPFLYRGSGVTFRKFAQEMRIANNFVCNCQDVAMFESENLFVQNLGVIFDKKEVWPTQLSFSTVKFNILSQSATWSVPYNVAKIKQLSLLLEIPAGEKHTLELTVGLPMSFQIPTNISVQSSANIFQLPDLTAFMPSANRLLESGTLTVKFTNFQAITGTAKIILEAESEDKIAVEGDVQKVEITRTKIEDRHKEDEPSSNKMGLYIGIAVAAVVVIVIIVVVVIVKKKKSHKKSSSSSSKKGETV